MEITYRKNLGTSYMCIEEEGELIEPYELRMLENRKIPCLLRMQIVISEGKNRYLYDISGKQQIGDYFSGKKMEYDFLRVFLFSVLELCASLPEYLLREEGICLKEEFMYVNLEDGSLQFTYLPFYHKNLPEAFQICMEQILRKIDHQDSVAVELGYQTYQLCIKENVNIRKLLESVLGKRPFCKKLDAGGESEGIAASEEYDNSARKSKEEKENRELVRPCAEKKEKTDGKGKDGISIKAWKSDRTWMQPGNKDFRQHFQKGIEAAGSLKKYLFEFCRSFTLSVGKQKQEGEQKKEGKPAFP